MKFAVMDFETTGGQAEDQIIQVGLVIIEDERITQRYSTYVKPTIPIPPFITGLTGIDAETVADAPDLEQVIMELQPLLHESALVAHNVGFDLAFLQRALDSSGYMPFSGPVLDSIDFLRILFPFIESLQLNHVSHYFKIDHIRPHQADSDAEVTAEIWLRCLTKLRELPLLTLQRLTALFEQDYTHRDLAWLLRTILDEREAAPDADEEAEGFTYHRQFVLKVGDWGDEAPVRPAGEHTQLEEDFEPFYERIKHLWKQRDAYYEERDAQKQMLEEVSASFHEQKHLMIEAGTGTGKSLGYLIPSLYHGIRDEEPVLVSTHTINLQEQLRTRDVPLLQDIFPVPFRAAVLKGRSHYLCLRKFENKVNTSEFEYPKEDRITAGQMIVWLSETEHGDEEELHIHGRGAEFWRSVSSDAESCMNRACPWFKKCFYHRARHTANQADVIITNHSLLFTDIRADHRLLPMYNRLVIDEAHHLEEVASKHMGIEASYLSVTNSIWRLYKDANSGQLTVLRSRLMNLPGEWSEKAGDWISSLDRSFEALIEAKQQWDHLAEALNQCLEARVSDAGEAGQLVRRIKDEEMPAQWEDMLKLEENIYTQLDHASSRLDRLFQELKDIQETADLKSMLTDLAGGVKELNRQKDAVRFFMKRTDKNYVYWLEANPQFRMRSLHLFSVPVDVSPLLKKYFFDEKESVVLTSATLSVNKSFDYTKSQLGLAASTKLNSVQLQSPFNYRQQALVVIPRDFPAIRGRMGEEIFVEKLIASLAEVARETRGRMLVLFTSYRMLKSVYPELKEKLSEAGIQVLGQGIDSFNRSKLTKSFQENGAAVLLGTNSFWEGVDIPGEALTCLAIVRLPFQPPNHPVSEAKMDELKKNNQNPFMKLSVPQAVIRFKQGFGRLVRRASDKGIVILYDTRVIETQYGKHFLYSLPGPKIEHMSTQQMVPRIKQWMEEQG
ncbi:ATP-dependent DNA helicase DinG [Paenibacillus senegalensis]|uniref:ATP-dependent DNA helicase DinG n=1 Tax=Paenibacillus senegalensis TaxID=1465766 RepID=UPI00028930E1|nr:ATP-dependent DNA helicase DinG [Paenibacillus senegalensis]